MRIPKQLAKRVIATIRLMLSIQHSMNPLHLYCRLMDMGFKKRHSILLARYYEILVYKCLVLLTRIFIFLLRSRRQTRPTVSIIGNRE